jgi:glycosyltransferase involved in cell wall biosynthesis
VVFESFAVEPLYDQVVFALDGLAATATVFSSSIVPNWLGLLYHANCGTDVPPTKKAACSTDPQGSMLVSIITPFLDEEQTLPILLERAAAAPLPSGMTREFVLVDDGSRDRSNAVAVDFVRRNPDSARLLTSPCNQGKGAAMRSGLAVARGDIILIQDADLEWDPADYARLLAPYADPAVSVVFGSRLMGNEAHCIYYHYYLGGRMLSAWTNLLFGSHITDEPTGMKSFRRGVLDGITLSADGFDFDPELTARLLQTGHTIYEVPVRYQPRTFKQGKKVRPRDGLRALRVLLQIRLEGKRRHA